MAKKYLITGGSGFIGSAIVKRMVADGFKIRVFDNNFRGAMRKLEDVKNKIEFVKGDIRNAGAIEKAANGVDSVIHLAFVNGTEFFYEMPELVLEVGVKGIVNVLDACLKHKIGELVLASSSEVYQNPPSVPTDEKVRMIVPDPLNPRYSYAGGKIISELMAINYGRKYFKKVLTFRPHNVYGPDMGWEHVLPQMILRAKDLAEKDKSNPLPFPIQGSGEETRSFCHINDFTDGFMVMLEKGEHLNIYNIGNQEEIKIKEVAEKVVGYFGRKAKIIPGELKTGGTPRRCPNISKLAQLGYQPKISFDQGLKSIADWYVKNAELKPKK